MSATVRPNLGLTSRFEIGQNGWGGPINANLDLLDAITQAGVISIAANTPPTTPAEGDRHIVGTAPTGDWATHANQIAVYTDAAWVFYSAHFGVRVIVKGTPDKFYYHNGTSWVTEPKGDYDADIAALNSEVADLDTQVGSLSTTVTGHTGDITELQGEVASLNTAVGGVGKVETVPVLASRKLALTDAFKYLDVPNATTTTVTIPSNDTVALDVGTQIVLHRSSTGRVVLAFDTGVTVNVPSGGSLELDGKGATVMLYKKSTNVWDVSGQTARGTDTAPAWRTIYSAVEGFGVVAGDRTELFILKAAADLAAGTVKLPANPYDGQPFTITATKTITTLTVNANTGQTIGVALQPGVSAFSAIRLNYQASDKTWYPA